MNSFEHLAGNLYALDSMKKILPAGGIFRAIVNN